MNDQTLAQMNDEFLDSVAAIEKRREWIDQKTAMEKAKAVKVVSRQL